MMRTLALAAVGLLGAASAPSLLAQEATLTVVHGIPGEDACLEPDLPVDVAVDGVCLLESFTFGENTDPLTFDAGTRNIQISLADPDEPCSNPPVIEGDFDFEDGENATVIAHLAEDFSLTATKFTNDVSDVRLAKSRFIVHHTAAAPAVDILLDRRTVFPVDQEYLVPRASNGAQAQVGGFIGVWDPSFLAAGTDTSVIESDFLALPARVNAIYAVGSLDIETFQLIAVSL